MTEQNWVKACSADDIDLDDLKRFDHGGKTFAIYKLDDGIFATDGHCTHEKQHLEGGLVDDGVIECPLHMGQFDIRTGEALAGPVCVDLRTYETKVEDGQVFILV